MRGLGVARCAPSLRQRLTDHHTITQPGSLIDSVLCVCSLYLCSGYGSTPTISIASKTLDAYADCLKGKSCECSEQYSLSKLCGKLDLGHNNRQDAAVIAAFTAAVANSCQQRCSSVVSHNTHWLSWPVYRQLTGTAVLQAHRW
jgi:DNA polymerase III epsilon subunit-like protein